MHSVHSVEILWVNARRQCVVQQFEPLEKGGFQSKRMQRVFV